MTGYKKEPVSDCSLLKTMIFHKDDISNRLAVLD
jgi:hypothetical protein